ncbi:MAG: putative sugar nucleotidyl transferase [Gemmatimonadaceae bacterium]
MTDLYLYDDALARTFEPFALTRPVSELRAGAELLRRRWERISNIRATGFIGAAHLADFEEFDAPHALPADADIAAGSIVANSRFVLALDELLDPSASAWRSSGQVCAVRLSHPVAAASLADGTLSLESLAHGDATELRGRWVSAIWDFIAQLRTQLADDIDVLAASVTPSAHPAVIIGDNRVTIEQGATIEPYVVFDASGGAIMIRRGALISAFTRLVGPCYVGSDSTIVGDRVANCSIGDRCKIRGEISSTIVLGHSNKGHTGFVGHSYLGRWVNLGAGTTTSNLKNTYGTVQLWTPAGMVDTGQQFLGTVFGDHSKTGIGTMLTTGTVLGAGANVYGSGSHPKHVSPFAWGDGEPYVEFQAEKFLDVAERVMKRRDVTLTDGMRRHLALAHARGTRS